MRLKIFLLISLALAAFVPAAFAQPGTQGRAQLQPVQRGDTLVNTDTLVKEFLFTDGYAGCIITPVVVKISGTVAGTVYLYDSPNGVDYSTSPIDSLVLSNSSGRQFPAHGWRVTAPVAGKYKAVFIAAGTQSYYTRFYVLPRYYSNQH